MMKKLLNLLTMLLLLVVSQEMMGKTIYFYNNSKWEKVYAYAWNVTTNEKNNEFPGIEYITTTTTVNGATVYKIDLDDKYDKVILCKDNSTNHMADQDLGDDAYYNSNGATTLEAIEKDAGVLRDYYFVGAKYDSNGAEIAGSSNWDATNASDSYKFAHENKLFSYSITATENVALHFRIGTTIEGTTTMEKAQWGPTEKIVQEAKTLTPSEKEVYHRDYTTSDSYFLLNLEKGKKYTIYFNPVSSKVSYAVTPTESVAYQLVAVPQHGGDSFSMPMSQTRHRNSNSYNYDLWTAGFKSDLLPKQDTYNIYIKKTIKGADNSEKVTYLYPDPAASLGADQVPGLGLDYTNLKSVENIVYSEGSQPYPQKLTVTKGEASSFTVALNLGGKIEKGKAGNNDMMTFAFAANSMSLYKNNSISAVYESMYGDSYKKEAEDYYLIGQLDGSTYVPKRTSKTLTPYAYTNPLAYKNTYLMERKVFYNPITAAIDSVVYSKVVKKTESGFNQLFLSFAPKVLLENAGGKSVGNQGPKYWGNYKEGGDGAVYEEEAWNYLVRPEVFDEQDATAQMGSVYFLGSSTNDYAVRTKNGNQALNPLVLNSADYDYYIVRLNVTTSTYRIEFVKKEKVRIPVDGIRTYCGQTSLRIPTNDTKGLKDKVHFYAVQSYSETEQSSTHPETKGTLKLRALKYIPANEPIVLVVDKVDNTLAGDVITVDGKKVYGLDLEVMYDTDTDYTTTKTDWWKKDYSSAEEETDRVYNNYLVASLFGTTIENGVYSIKNGKYEYAARNFALNKYSNTKYFQALYPTEAEREQFKADGKDYYSFFRAKGTVRAGYAYLQLPSSVMNFNGQLLDHAEDDSYHFAKMNLVFDDIEGDVTGIEEVKTGSNASVREDGAYYTLQGLKVEKPTKGLYIHNGKKVIIK